MTESNPSLIDNIQAELSEFRPRPEVLVAGLVLIASLLFVYFWRIVALVHTWATEPDYGHGFFVPVFAIVLLWHRREMMKPAPKRGSWYGLAILAFWMLMRWAAVWLNYPAIDRLSLVVCVTGFTLLLGGWQALHWAWQSILFLFFMLPLPAFFDAFLSMPLRAISTRISVFVIQIFVPATQSGNRIDLANIQTPLEVADACSGLRMLMLFFAICVGAAMILKREPWEKAVIVISAMPIAIISNVARVSSTGLFYHFDMGEHANEVFHDIAGLAMMPLALLLLWAELTLMNKLFIDPSSQGPVALGRTTSGSPPRNNPPMPMK